MNDQTEQPVPPRPRGRPRKNPLPVMEREPMREEVKTNVLKMRNQPNWDTVDPSAVGTPDRLFIDPNLIPDGYTLQWVTDSVLGQGVPQHRSEFEKTGWTPLHGDDLDGQFDGMFMKKGATGEINVEGLVLMIRPKQMSEKAQSIDRKKAYDQVRIKEQALTGGDLTNVTLDTRHPSAVASNKINRSYERIEIPNE
jgi:hypothetical protein